MTNEREVFRLLEEIEEHLATIVDQTSEEGATKMIWATSIEGIKRVEQLKELLSE